MNGSPLFTGDAGSGESEIRRWLLENDWVEAIIQLPEQLFYNTGTSTYVWVLSNVKAARRRGTVQLIDASDVWLPMRKSIEVNNERDARLTFDSVAEDELQGMIDKNVRLYQKIVDNETFGRMLFDFLFDRIVDDVHGREGHSGASHR